jgi:hypothetical protein
MRFPMPTRLVMALLAISFASSGCMTTGVTPKSAVQLPPPPAFIGACTPSGVKVGDAPNAAFDAEHASFKACSRAGAASRAWYVGVRQRYGAAKLK